MLLLAAVAASFVIDGLPATRRASTAPSATVEGTDCTPVPFRLPGGRLMSGDRVELRPNGVARGRVCGPTRLTMLLDRAPSDAAAHVVVSWRYGNLWEGDVEGPRRLELDVPDAGWIAIASVTAPDRLAGTLEGAGLWISGLELAASR